MCGRPQVLKGGAHPEVLRASHSPYQVNQWRRVAVREYAISFGRVVGRPQQVGQPDTGFLFDVVLCAPHCLSYDMVLPHGQCCLSVDLGVGVRAINVSCGDAQYLSQPF